MDKHTYELAKRVVTLLDLQKNYFRTKNKDLLARCKEMEKDLYGDCQFVIKREEGEILL